MPTIRKKISEDGLPRINIRFRQKQEGGLVQSELLVAVIDTGASDLFVLDGFLRGMGFHGKPWGTLSTGAGVVSFVGYELELAIAHKEAAPTWLATRCGEAPRMPWPECDAAIGTSFLKGCKFTYDGINGEFCLEW